MADEATLHLKIETDAEDVPEGGTLRASAVPAERATQPAMTGLPDIEVTLPPEVAQAAKAPATQIRGQPGEPDDFGRLADRQIEMLADALREAATKALQEPKVEPEGRPVIPADEALRHVPSSKESEERAGQLPRVRATDPAVERALKQIDQEREGARTVAARRAIDPAFDAERRQAETQQKIQGLTQALAFGAVGLQASGLPGSRGLAGIAGGAATGAAFGALGGGGAGAVAGAVAGGIAAIAGEILNQMNQAMKVTFSLATSMASMDPQKLARGFADLAEKVPIVGGLLGTFSKGILDLNDAIRGSAERLAGFSPEITAELVSQDITRLMLDIRRAQQFGPEMVLALQRQFQLEMRLQRLIERSMPALLRFAQLGAGFLQLAIPLIEGGINLSGSGLRRVVVGTLGQVAGGALADAVTAFFGLARNVQALADEIPNVDFGIQDILHTPPMGSPIGQAPAAESPSPAFGGF